MGSLFGLVCGCVGVGAVLLVLGGLLRLSVWLANRAVGATPSAAVTPARPPRRGGIPEWDWDDWDDDADDERLEPQKPWRDKRAIPEPGTFKSMAIMLLTSLAYGFGFLMTGFAANEMGFRMWREETRLAVGVLNLPVGLGALAVLLAITLPTRFWRAAMVAFIYGLVLVALAGVFGCVIGGLSIFLR